MTDDLPGAWWSLVLRFGPGRIGRVSLGKRMWSGKARSRNVKGSQFLFVILIGGSWLLRAGIIGAVNRGIPIGGVAPGIGRQGRSPLGTPRSSVALQRRVNASGLIRALASRRGGEPAGVRIILWYHKIFGVVKISLFLHIFSMC
jgi:hypothetical protein